MRFGVAILTLAACSDTVETTEVEQPISAAKRAERLTAIRDLGAEMGMVNAALIGGIAVSETQLAHCQSEATYACKGPASPSCGGGPVIAGSADGPCANEQGGLGMFQFDAGTYAQTLAAYGDEVLTVEGNTALAVNFVVDKTILDIDGVTDWRSAMAWMNAIPMVAGDPTLDAWGHLLACRYNGCCSSSATCTSRANGYRDNALVVYGELGADAWNAARTRCARIPDGGVIEQRSECYVAAGDPRSWRREAEHEWTNTTADVAPANYAEWHIRAGAAGMLHVEASIPTGATNVTSAARYEIHHAGVIDRVTIDQAASAGYVALGDFMFDGGDADEYILLGDDTGDATAHAILFDAIRVTGEDAVVDPPPPPPSDGGCAAGGSTGFIAVALLAENLRRRRRRAHVEA